MCALFVCVAVVDLATASDGSCPEHALDTNAEGKLIDALREAASAHDARSLNAQLWQLWTDAPDAYAQDLLDGAMARIRMGDLGAAIKALNVLVDYCPSYAEGYNQRAFAYYLRQDFEIALIDLDRALERSPRHIGALSGKALTLVGLGRERDALSALRQALDLNPWLSERALLDGLERKLGEQEI